MCLDINNQNVWKDLLSIKEKLAFNVEGHHLQLFIFAILNPQTPMIWLLILPSSCYTFPCKLVFENLVLNQDSSFYMISFNILITCLLNNVWILKGKFHVNHFWQLKGQLFTLCSTSLPQLPAACWHQFFFTIFF